MPAEAPSVARTPLNRALWDADRTGRWLAREIGVHEEQVARWRHGRHVPKIETQQLIVKALAPLVDWVSIASLWPKDEA
jgi:hypothetical protein